MSESYTAFHAVENVKQYLAQHGFTCLLETEDWQITEGGKYYVIRNSSSIVAFTVGSLDGFCYKIVASHPDSPALKHKENPVNKGSFYATLNVEPYGVAIWHTFLDRPLKIAGRVVKKENGKLVNKCVCSDFNVCIPSLAIHQDRNVNDGFTVNKQVDLQPLLGLSDEELHTQSLLERVAGEGVLAYDLYLVNADMPYSFGINDEFLAAPRVDNLTSVYASLLALTECENANGVCIAAMLDNEEIGSKTMQGADGDFLENVLRRIGYALRFDENEYFKALASSFIFSMDNAHATHPNHPEKSDPTNKTALGGGIVIKSHAGKAYITDAMSAAVARTIFDKAGAKHQTFYNHSNLKSGGTLGAFVMSHVGICGADIGIAQLAMHSACECFAKSDFMQAVKGLRAFYTTKIECTEDGVIVE